MFRMTIDHSRCFHRAWNGILEADKRSYPLCPSEYTKSSSLSIFWALNTLAKTKRTLSVTKSRSERSDSDRSCCNCRHVSLRFDLRPRQFSQWLILGKGGQSAAVWLLSGWARQQASTVAMINYETLPIADLRRRAKYLLGFDCAYSASSYSCPLAKRGTM